METELKPRIWVMKEYPYKVFEEFAPNTEKYIRADLCSTRPETDPDISKCPRCGGEADNGHDRCYPPNPYNCTKCEETDLLAELLEGVPEKTEYADRSYVDYGCPKSEEDGWNACREALQNALRGKG